MKAANAPRPGQWLLERSVDGVSYSVWQYFAMTDSDCWNVFGVQPTIGVPRYETDDQVHCSSAFSQLNPLQNGEVSDRDLSVIRRWKIGSIILDFWVKNFQKLGV